MKPIYFKSALNCNSFGVATGIKIPFFRDLVTIKPDRSLLQFVTTNCLLSFGIKVHKKNKKKTLFRVSVTIEPGCSLLRGTV